MRVLFVRQRHRLSRQGKLINQDEKIKAPSPPTSPLAGDQAFMTPVEQRKVETEPSLIRRVPQW